MVVNHGSRSKARPAGAPAAHGRARTRVVGDVCVSTERQADEGVSLDAQRAKLRAHCAALDLVAVEADEGVSAKTLDRPALQRALAALRDGRADALLVPKLDRLTRRVVDLGHRIETYFAEGRWALLSGPHQTHTPPAAGRIPLFNPIPAAPGAREASGARAADALVHLRAEGVPLGRPALGWRHIPETDPATGRRVLGAVAEEFAVVARIGVLRAEGRSYAAIARQLAAEGHPSQRGGRWLPNTVRRVWLRCAAPVGAGSATARRTAGRRRRRRGW